METDFSHIKAALVVMSNAVLDALIKATYKVESRLEQFSCTALMRIAESGPVSRAGLLTSG